MTDNQYCMRLPSSLTITSVILLALVVGFCLWFFGLAYEYPSSSQINIQARPKNLLGARDQTITLIAVGDIMLSRNVEQKMINKNDWLYPFRETYQITSPGDLTFGNLESPLMAGPIVQTGQMVFRADPKAVEGLKFGGFNVLSLANNHLKNKGDAGIQKTLEVLDANNIVHTGAGMNMAEARQPAVVEIKGKKFGFLAYVDSSFTPASYEATANRGGSPFLNEQTLIEDINQLKNKVDFIIVSMHAGSEYILAPTVKQKSFAHTAIDQGANLVIGHHPHIVQPVEKYQDGYILYSLGNFIFDQMWSEETREGAIAAITFSNTDIAQVELTPLKIYDFSQPRVLSDSEGKPIIDRMLNFTF